MSIKILLDNRTYVLYTGIIEGDLVIVEKGKQPRNGDVWTELKIGGVVTAVIRKYHQ